MRAQYPSYSSGCTEWSSWQARWPCTLLITHPLGSPLSLHTSGLKWRAPFSNSISTSMRRMSNPQCRAGGRGRQELYSVTTIMMLLASFFIYSRLPLWELRGFNWTRLCCFLIETSARCSERCCLMCVSDYIFPWVMMVWIKTCGSCSARRGACSCALCAHASVIKTHLTLVHQPLPRSAYSVGGMTIKPEPHASNPPTLTFYPPKQPLRSRSTSGVGKLWECSGTVGPCCSQKASQCC